jgi:putative transcriptional regulator
VRKKSISGTRTKKKKPALGKKWGTPLPKMSDAEVLAAAKSDPDAPPLSAAQLRKFKRVSPVKYVRWQLGLSQSEFAKRYQIPIGTLRDWEQGRTEPDQAARAFLKVIEAKPELVSRTLKASA